MSKWSVAIVPNNRPAYVAEPLEGESGVEDIVLEAIVAWQVIYDHSSDTEVASAVPVTIHSSLPSTYAVYYSDTHAWSEPEGTMGKGLDDLLVEFRSRHERSNG